MSTLKNTDEKKNVDVMKMIHDAREKEEQMEIDCHKNTLERFFEKYPDGEEGFIMPYEDGELDDLLDYYAAVRSLERILERRKKKKNDSDMARLLDDLGFHNSRDDSEPEI